MPRFVINHDFSPVVEWAEGLYLHIKAKRGKGIQKIMDASGGAAVVSIGHGHQSVIEAMIKQLKKVTYFAGIFAITDVTEEMGQALIQSTNIPQAIDPEMSNAFFVNSGSEAMESSVKYAMMYFYVKNEHQRDKDKERGESDEQYVQRLARELDQKFNDLRDADNKDTVIAFVAEPIVGAALGCVGPVKGYFEAMQRVCDDHGALLIFDEVMCGMGRTGSVHAWQHKDIDVVPDIQAIGKSLRSGYQPITAMLVRGKAVKEYESYCEQNGYAKTYIRGHTYESHPICCTAALEVTNIITKQQTLNNVIAQGQILKDALEQHVRGLPGVIGICGRGLFWGIKLSPKFDPQNIIKLCGTAEHRVFIYPGKYNFIVSPPYTITNEEMKELAERVVALFKAGTKDFKQ